MDSASRSGAPSHARSCRAPTGVDVRSSSCTSAGSSRLRTVAASSGMAASGEIVRTRWFEVCIFDNRAWCQDAGDVALDNLVLACCLDLVADDDLVAGPQQLAHVRLPGVMGHPAHGRAAALPKRARGELHPHDRSRDLRVLEEDLVEVAQTEQEDPVGMLLLGLPVLPHHRGRRRIHAAGSPNNCPAVAWMTRRFTTSPGATSRPRRTIARLPWRMRPYGRCSSSRPSMSTSTSRPSHRAVLRAAISRCNVSRSLSLRSFSW